MISSAWKLYLPLGLALKGGWSNLDAATIHSLRRLGEVLGISQKEEGDGSDMLHVAASRFVDEATRCVLNV